MAFSGTTRNERHHRSN